MKFSELKEFRFWVAVLTELQATLFFVLFTTGSAMSLNNPSFLHIALTFGLTIATLVHLTAHISGGHINPAVSIAMAVTGHITFVRGIFYVIAQCVGAICGSAILSAITPNSVEGNLAADKVQDGVSVGAAFTVEFFITWQFVLVVFATTDRFRKESMGSPALAIGLSIAIGHLFAIGYTNCGMNPARSLGPAVISGFWTHHWIFWVAPLLAGILAGWQYDHFLSPTSSMTRLKNYLTCGDMSFEYNGDTVTTRRVSVEMK